MTAAAFLFIRWILKCIFLTMLVLSYSSAGHAAQNITLKVAGHALRGQVVKVDAEEVTLKFQAGHSQAIPLSFLSKKDHYRCLKQLSDPKDPEAQYKLGTFCQKEGLFREANEAFTQCLLLARSTYGEKVAAQRSKTSTASGATTYASPSRNSGGPRARATPTAAPKRRIRRFGRAPNPIDGFIQKRMQEAGFKPSRICSDQVFVRRVYLDVVGILPTPLAIKKFLADRSRDKRSALIDELLAHPYYGRHWSVMWGDLLRERYRPSDERPNEKHLRHWIRDALNRNLPYDQFATALITARGTANTNGAVHFYLRDGRNRTETVNTISGAFMGTRMSCAQCHDHPFDNWDQKHFHQLLAFFVPRTQVSGNSVKESDSGEYHAKFEGGGLMKPVFPWKSEWRAEGKGSRREKLARFVVGHKRFTMNHANRVWGRLFGQALVEPQDDLRNKNMPLHPDLLVYLAKELIRTKYDNKHLLRLILNSQTYQRSSIPTRDNRVDAQFFSHQNVRRMTAEQVYDSILVATGQREGIPIKGWAAPSHRKNVSVKKPIVGGAQRSSEPGDSGPSWAFGLRVPSSYGSFMRIFHQPDRSERVYVRESTPTISQALELFNGRAINEAVRRGGLLTRLKRDVKNTRSMVAEMYLATLSRYPTSRELEHAVGRMGSSSRGSLEDLLWALMNAREFMFIK